MCFRMLCVTLCNSGTKLFLSQLFSILICYALLSVRVWCMCMTFVTMSSLSFSLLFISLLLYYRNVIHRVQVIYKCVISDGCCVLCKCWGSRCGIEWKMRTLHKVTLIPSNLQKNTKALKAAQHILQVVLVVYRHIRAHTHSVSQVPVCMCLSATAIKPKYAKRDG